VLGRKKKKKHEMSVMDMDDDGFPEEDIDDRAVSRERSNLTIAQLEAEAQKAEERAKELEAWVADFNLGRRDFDPSQNSIYRENFVATTKTIYEKIALQTKREEQILNLLGVFDPEQNAVRAESLRRVKLAKRLQLNEIRKRTSKMEFRPRVPGDNDSESYQDDPQRKVRESSLFNETPRSGPQRKTLRQRTQEAAATHRQRQLVGYEVMGKLGRMDREVSKDVLMQYMRPESSQNRLERIQTGNISRDGTPVNHMMMRERHKARHAGSARKAGHETGDDDGNGVMESQEEMEKDAPTPDDIIEIHDGFQAKRSEIRLRSKDSKEVLKEDLKQIDQKMTPILINAKHIDSAEVSIHSLIHSHFSFRALTAASHTHLTQSYMCIAACRCSLDYVKSMRGEIKCIPALWSGYRRTHAFGVSSLQACMHTRIYVFTCTCIPRMVCGNI
jgi:hypothetical protein